MFTLKIAYNDNSIELIKELEKSLIDYPLVELESYHEDFLKERKKAFGLKTEWGTRQSPFAILLDDEKKPIIAFYNERNDCTLDKILESLQSFIAYENTSN